MYKLLALCLCLVPAIALAVDTTGTWKLNTAKSKYTGMPAPKELTVTYAPQGSGWVYQGSGMSAMGEPIKTNFTYVKDGAEISTMGFPNWDTLVLRDGAAEKASGVMKREGKEVGTLTRTISSDGKMMTIQGKLTMPDGKKASYVTVYDKQ